MTHSRHPTATPHDTPAPPDHPAPDRRPKPLLTKGEVAGLFSVTPRTVSNWVAQKRLTPVKMGRLVYFHREEIEAITGPLGS